MAKFIGAYAEKLKAHPPVNSNSMAVDLATLAAQLESIRTAGIKAKIETKLLPALPPVVDHLREIFEKINKIVTHSNGTFDNVPLAQAYMLDDALKMVKRAMENGSTSDLAEAQKTLGRIEISKFFAMYEKPIAHSEQHIHAYYRANGSVKSAKIFGIGPVTSGRLEEILAVNGWEDIENQINELFEIVKESQEESS
jgi:DNA-directed RNA polymerase subunit F